MWNCALAGKTLGKIPLHTLQSIACFGRISCSQYLLEHCARLGVLVTWFTEYGRFMAAMHGPTTGNVLLRRAQYRLADSSEASSELARFFIVGKIANCRTVLLRQARKTGEPALETTAEKLGMILRRLAAPHGLETLRGLEGDAAHLYFGVSICS